MTNQTSKCKSIFGHRYKPVVTKSGAKIGEINAQSITQSALDSLVDSTRDQTFNGVYCVRCGDIKELQND